jgi:hypothetical protein
LCFLLDGLIDTRPLLFGPRHLWIALHFAPQPVCGGDITPLQEYKLMSAV